MLIPMKDGEKEIILSAVENLISNEVADLILFGDGSGTTAEKCGSYGCWRYDKTSQSLTFHFAGFSEATNNFAELMPYIGVLWYDAYQKPDFPRRVLIISDSELTVKQGQGEYSKNTNQILWGCLDYLCSLGYSISWKHVRRNSNPLHTFCDRQAGRLRKELERFRLTMEQESVIIK